MGKSPFAYGVRNERDLNASRVLRQWSLPTCHPLRRRLNWDGTFYDPCFHQSPMVNHLIMYQRGHVFGGCMKGLPFDFDQNPLKTKVSPLGPITRVFPIEDDIRASHGVQPLSSDVPIRHLIHPEIQFNIGVPVGGTSCSGSRQHDLLAEFDGASVTELLGDVQSQTALLRT